AYKKYLEQYPEGNYASRAKELLNIAQRNSMYPINIAPLTYEPEKKSSAQTSSQATTQQYAAVESKPNKQLEEMFKKAIQFFESGKYQEASIIFKSISDYKEPQNDSEDEMIETSLFQYGVCLKETKNFEEAYSILSTYVKKYPKGARAKAAIFNLGLISIEKGEKEKAIMLFNKVSILPPEDQLSEQAKAKISELKG
ncbi:MAG: tetratricopeptide repeat protein, partial [Leptospiraceae bacterium]|nr:tetratricopeptide repeat protein [Leptospiraceae bacterium]